MGLGAQCLICCSLLHCFFSHRRIHCYNKYYRNNRYPRTAHKPHSLEIATLNPVVKASLL